MAGVIFKRIMNTGAVNTGGKKMLHHRQEREKMSFSTFTVNKSACFRTDFNMSCNGFISNTLADFLIITFTFVRKLVLKIMGRVDKCRVNLNDERLSRRTERRLN